MSVKKALQIISDDDDYDDDGYLKDDSRDSFEDKYGETDFDDEDDDL